MGRVERRSSEVGEVINWEEKYVSYVEGDLRRDIQELKNGQERLDTKIDDLRKELDTKIDDLRKELGSKIDRMTYIIVGAFAVALIGGLIKLFIG
ncbi:MAG: hypothetical protein M0Z41_08620 [Peptococcaceae bacterium]|jgi:chromosome segregation ATPase|nr:hypothetical protein [Peptococcaceae bacterium]